MSYYRDALEKYISQLEIVADTVVDIGGGQKPMTKRNIKKWEVDNYLILDNDNQFNPDLLIDINKNFESSGYLRADSLTTALAFGIYKHPGSMHEVVFGNKKDRNIIEPEVILCFEVMEYIWNPVQAHYNIWQLLAPKGIAYISYPTIYPLHPPKDIDYLRYTKNAIEKLLTETGFKSWEITPRTATEGGKDLANFYSKERMRPMKNTRDIFDIGYMVRAFK